MIKTGFGVVVVAGVLGLVQAAPGPVVYFAFEEAAGPTAADGSGNGYTGTHQNTVVVSTDRPPVPTANARSILLNQGSNGYVSVPHNAAFTFTGAFTAAAWIKPAALAAGVNPNDRGAVIQKWNWLATPGTINGYGVDRHRDGRIIFFSGTTTAYDTMWSTGTAPDGEWTHVAVTYDGTDKRIYLNGVLDSTKAYGPPGASTANLHIGKDDWTRYFYGHIDEVRLYGQTLSAQEISILHAGLAAPTGLVATADINQVHLSWTAVSGATSYTVYQSTTSGSGYVAIGSPTGTSYTDGGATYPTTYYYVVVADGLIDSGYSNEVSVVPLSGIPRTNDHDEGLFDDRCSCGSSIPGAPVSGAALVALLLAAAVRRRS